METEVVESIVFKGFLVPLKVILSSHFRWFIAISLIIFGLVRCVMQLEEDYVPLGFYSGTYRTIRMVINNSNAIIHIAVVLFALDWSSFTHYLRQMSKLQLEKHEKTVAQINKERRIKLLFCLSSAIIYAVLICYKLFLGEIKVNMFLLNLSDCLTKMSHIFFLNIISDVCICLKAAFQLVTSQLKDFPKSTPDSTKLHRLRYCRLLHSHAVRATRHAEKFLCFYISWYYFQYIMYNMANFVEVLGDKHRYNWRSGSFFIWDTINLSYLTIKLVAVSELSANGLEDLYEISYDVNSIKLQFETHIFFNRMQLNNVGFTFAKLFFINTNFIASLLTLSLTIVLALANFLQC
uniref:Gustatory receptor n=1 Tax=Tetranychus urticae TaxID=32264 RepID=T1JU78_TETUR